MFSVVTSKVSKVAMTGLVLATVGFGLFSGGGHVHAQDNEGGVWTDCYYAGLVYSDGAVITVDGVSYRCSSGTWTKARVVPTGGLKGQVFQRAATLQMAP